jgi:hypothetical protein
MLPFDEGPLAKLDPKGRADLGHALMAWTHSQFMHAEQGALLCTAKVAISVPSIDAKCFAATQVMDEARHTEVFAKYVREKLEWEFPLNVHLRSLLDDLLLDSRWDVTYLGMQVMLEGLALAMFGLQHHMNPDPLMKKITRYVMRDEARHVAFGVLELREVYAEMSSFELRTRQEFAYEVALRMLDRLLYREVWEALDLPVEECSDLMRSSPQQAEFRRCLFSKIVPNLKALGLLDADDGWLRRRFQDLGAIEFESFDNAIDLYEGQDYTRYEPPRPQVEATVLDRLHWTDEPACEGATA